MKSDRPLTITLEPDKDMIREWEKATRGVLNKEEFNKAVALAINRALEAATAESKRQITKQYTVKKKDLDDAISQRKASPNFLGAELTYKGPRLNLLQFVVKPPEVRTFKGMPKHGRPKLFVQIRRDGGGLAEGLFVQQIRFNKAVYKRADSERYPVLLQQGPSAASMAGTDTSAAAIQARAQEILDRRIEHEMKRALRK